MRLATTTSIACILIVAIMSLHSRRDTTSTQPTTEASATDYTLNLYVQEPMILLPQGHPTDHVYVLLELINESGKEVKFSDAIFVDPRLGKPDFRLQPGQFETAKNLRLHLMIFQQPQPQVNFVAADLAPETIHRNVAPGATAYFKVKLPRGLFRSGTYQMKAYLREGRISVAESNMIEGSTAHVVQ